jgi:hypothetical protein
MPPAQITRRCFLMVLAAAFLAGCSHVPVSTMYKLWSFDVLSADPAAIRAAVRYPESLIPRPGGAKLTVTITGAKGEAPDVRAFVLEETTQGSELTEVSTYNRAGYPIRVYRLSEKDAVNVRALLKELREAKQRSEKRSGSIGVSIDACRVKELPKKAILTSTYLKLDSTGGYMTVLEDVDLRNEVTGTELDKTVPPCAPARS